MRSAMSTELSQESLQILRLCLLRLATLTLPLHFVDDATGKDFSPWQFPEIHTYEDEEEA